MQVVRGAEDRVVIVVDVAAHAVRAPRRGDELHRALRSGRAGRDDAAELRLDVVDRGEDRPRHREPLLRLRVEALEDAGRLRKTDANTNPVANRADEGVDVAAGGDVRRRFATSPRGQRGDRPAGERVVPGEL